ncbi:MAG: hypothetical protein WBC44_04635 [Planctomycetaceae bacterium]
MTNLEISVEQELAVRNCPTCGLLYGVDASYLKRKREKGGDWYCPAGHNLVYTESDLQKAQKELAAVKRRAEYYEAERNRAREQAEQEKRRSAAARGQVTKLKRRAAGGACPCCNRTFENLARHMQTKHPGFASEEIVTGEG